MAGKSLTEKLMNGVYSSILAGSLMLTGCGGGSTPKPPPPTPTLSQTISIEGANATYGATLTNTNQAIRKMTYNGNQFGNDTLITQQNYSEDLGCLNIGDYVSRLEATGAATHTLNWNISQINPTADFSSLNMDMNDKYDEKVHDLEGLVDDPNCEDTANVISANSLDGKTSVSVNGNELIVRGVAGSSGNYQIEIEYGSQEGGISKSILEGNMTEVPWQVAFYRLIEESPSVFSQDIHIMEIDAQGNKVGELKNLTNTHGQSQNVYPYYSPDGKHIAFTSNKDTKLRIYKMNADGSNVQRISPLNLDTALYPIWCSDGLIRFNYYDTQTNTQGISSIKPDGTDFKKIIEEPFVGRFSERSACSLDSSKLVYAIPEGDYELHISDSDGSNPLRLTDNALEDFGPVFGPDGRIYFTQSDPAGGSNVMRINPDGTGLERVTLDAGQELDITWTPDGLKALLTKTKAGFHIYSIDPDAGNEKQLTTDGIANRFPNVRPPINNQP